MHVASPSRSLLLLALVACGGRSEPAAPSPAAPSPAPLATPVADAAPATPEVAAAAPADAAPPVAAAPLADAGPPIATWPFVAWDRAEAITFNQVPYGPGIPLVVYDEDHGWSPHIADRKPITKEQATRAVGWVIATRGELEVSKCAFPRHAVVLYSGDRPVGTANVCFECGDILVWPPFEAEPKDERARAKLYQRKLKAYDLVFPKWQAFFRDELGLSIEPPKRP